MFCFNFSEVSFQFHFDGTNVGRSFWEVDLLLKMKLINFSRGGSRFSLTDVYMQERVSVFLREGSDHHFYIFQFFYCLSLYWIFVCLKCIKYLPLDVNNETINQYVLCFIISIYSFIHFLFASRHIIQISIISVKHLHDFINIDLFLSSYMYTRTHSF